jgi:hypothetical protein
MGQTCGYDGGDVKNEHIILVGKPFEISWTKQKDNINGSWIKFHGSEMDRTESN